MNTTNFELTDKVQEILSDNGVLDDIKLLNFSMIKMKLGHQEDGVGWNNEECNIAEMQYKRFLTLLKLYPSKSIVPNKTMDTFWHYHILDTRKYHKDSSNIFGEYLHHFPYFGLRGDEDKQNLNDAFEETKVLFRLHFGFEMNSTNSTCDQGGGNCVSSCNNQNCSR
jgi:hypothetical protein